MPIGEVILGTLGELIGYVFIELIFEGSGKLIRRIYYAIRKLITRKEREIPESFWKGKIVYDMVIKPYINQFRNYGSPILLN